MKRPLYLFLAASLSICCGAHAIDENSNGLSDVWEQRFNASDLILNADDDGDRFTNLEECIAGTDPFSSESRPSLLPVVIQNSPDDIHLQFQTLQGKHYSVNHSRDLSAFDPINKGWPGHGAVRELFIQKDGLAETYSPIQIDFWADLPANTVDTLKAFATFPQTPDGTMYQNKPEAPAFLATGYGAQIRFWVNTPESGNYTFYLSSGGPAEVFINLPPTVASPFKIAEVLPAQTGIQPGEWETYATQRSTQLPLTADTPYLITINYVGAIPKQHMQIAWSGPGLSGIELIDSDDLNKLYFHSETQTHSVLREHDYDSVGQTGQIWVNSAGLVTGTLDMSGYAERVTSDLGTLSQERIYHTPTTEHLYATWLFNMSAGAQHTPLFWMNQNDSNQEGPRIDLEDRSSGTIAEVRAGGSGGSDITIDVEFDKTFRIEMVTSLSASGFQYRTPTGDHIVSKDTFDIYVSDPNGNLIGSATGLNYRDGPNVVDQFSSVRLVNASAPNIIFDDWEITNGLIQGNGFLIPNYVDFGNGNTPNFFELNIAEVDQDGDGIPDWEELALAAHNELLFFDSETTNGTPDATAVANLITASQGVPDIQLFGSDACAMESNYPNTIPDNGEITITREGVLTPLTVQLEIIPLANTGETTTICNGICCMMVGTAGDEAAELEDYQLIDEDGTIVTDSVHFEFGETEKVLTVIATLDAINEYPETLNIGIADSIDGSYTASNLINGASIQIFDLPDSPDNITIFTGAFSQDGNAVIATNGAGSLTATINGPRTEMRFWNEYSNLTTAQQDSHVHKANPGNTAGSIIYPITNEPGGVSGPEPGSEPFNGQLQYFPAIVLAGDAVPNGVEDGDGYPWDLTQSSGAVPSAGGAASKQTIIDSLFAQNSETPLYLNIHTIGNPAGEIWAFLNLSEGSITDPGDAAPADSPGSTDFAQLSGDLLEVDIRRFLNQATFGATDASVDALLQTIATERISNPNYHRNTAYADWIDTQIDEVATPQTYLVDYMVAAYFQHLKISGVFDPARWAPITTGLPVLPTTWPTIDRSDSNPEHWYLDQVFPLNNTQYQLASDNLGPNLLSDGGYRSINRETFLQMMLNANDQLRQKMGFALQQIVVVSNSLSDIYEEPIATCNYQDQLNTHAFGHYRDVLGFVNWSPLMGTWLSSLKNQKPIDFDGDGLFDTYPDENLARENMQLFSIGLFEIWPNGDLKLTANGLPKASYTNADIREFAKILTGQSYSLTRENGNGDRTWGGQAFVPDNNNFFESDANDVISRSELYPMKMFGAYHNLGPKTFAGVTIDNSHLLDFSEQGVADIEDAIDWLAGKPGDGQPDYDMVNSHVSTPGFISLRLIQRFTTSNPSKDYLHRVATVFKNTEGDLGATLKAILLDPEARNIDLNNTTFGMKKSPLEGYLQMLRALDVYSNIPLRDEGGLTPYDGIGDYTNPNLYLENFGYPTDQKDSQDHNYRAVFSSFRTDGTEGLQMDVFWQPTVFNWYTPDFSPGGAIGDAGLVSPELQLANEPDVIRAINYFENITRSTSGQFATAIGSTRNDQTNPTGMAVDEYAQKQAFNSDLADQNEQIRLPLQALADTFYPATEPTSGLTTVANGTTSSTYGSSAVNASLPHWVRLNRTGDTFTTSESIDGITWTVVDTQVLPMASEVFIGLAVTSHLDGTLTTAEFSSVSITGGEGTWYSTEIGNVAASGSATENAPGEFTITASGNDIWSTNDECHKAYQHLTGDGEITTKVDSLLVTHEWAKAGVMIRETLEPNSANVFMYVSGSNGSRAQIRRVPRGRSSESFADEALVDELDKRLTNGLFKMRYPYDASDNDDPNVHGLDDFLKNPRELIIDAITLGYGDPYDGSSDDANRRDKLEDALYLLTFTPEYQVKK